MLHRHAVGPGPPVAVLVFLPGFMSAAESYGALLEPLTGQGISVIVPQLYRRGLGALAGRSSVQDEAAAAAELLRATTADHPDARVVLGGHSRGGQAAWRAANLLAADRGSPRRLPDALVLVDPVDGAGRDPSRPTATTEPARFTCPALVIGAGIGGRCAPDPVNHRVFARATSQARHVVVTELGHADILDGRARALGRRLCGGASNPDAGRHAVSTLLAAVSLGHSLDVDSPEGLLEWQIR